jgi:hypothetical protein
MKIEEIISQLAWSTAYIDGVKNAETKASESEKNTVRAFRKCFSISSERFNELLGIGDDKLIAELANQDPLSKLIAIYTCVVVAHSETEENGTPGTTSDKEWDFIYKIIEASGISNSVREAVRGCAKKLVLQLTNIELLEEDELMLDLLKMEIESGTFAEKYITPLLTLFFDAVEEESELLIWEENYLALKRNKRTLTKMFGEFSVKKWDDIYEDLKFNIKESKNKKNSVDNDLARVHKAVEKNLLTRETAEAKERQKRAAAEEKERQKLQKEEEKERLRKEKEDSKLAEKEKLNRTHEISSSKGIMST